MLLYVICCEIQWLNYFDLINTLGEDWVERVRSSNWTQPRYSLDSVTDMMALN